MKAKVYKAFGLVALFGALLIPCGMKEASAGVNVNINLGPPPIVVARPPEVVMIPGLPIYFVPNLDIDVFFYNGYWWSPRGGYWYRSRAYNGPWRGIDRRYVPAPLFRVPRDYQGIYKRERRIPYGQWKHREKAERGGWKEHGRGHGRDN